jgi:hypothetical protein
MNTADKEVADNMQVYVLKTEKFTSPNKVLSVLGQRTSVHLLEDKKITGKLTPDHVSLTWLSMHCLGSIKSVDFEKKLFNS